MSVLVLVPAPEVPGIPARMRQPTKDAYRQWLTQANERIEQLHAEVAELRAGDSTSTTRPGLIDDLVTAATALGHHETLRSSSDETIDYWCSRVVQLRAALNRVHAQSCRLGASIPELRSRLPNGIHVTQAFLAETECASDGCVCSNIFTFVNLHSFQPIFHAAAVFAASKLFNRRSQCFAAMNCGGKNDHCLQLRAFRKLAKVERSVTQSLQPSHAASHRVTVLSIQGEPLPRSPIIFLPNRIVVRQYLQRSGGHCNFVPELKRDDCIQAPTVKALTNEGRKKRDRDSSGCTNRGPGVPPNHTAIDAWFHARTHAAPQVTNPAHSLIPFGLGGILPWRRVTRRRPMADRRLTAAMVHVFAMVGLLAGMATLWAISRACRAARAGLRWCWRRCAHG